MNGSALFLTLAQKIHPMGNHHSPSLIELHWFNSGDDTSLNSFPAYPFFFEHSKHTVHALSKHDWWSPLCWAQGCVLDTRVSWMESPLSLKRYKEICTEKDIHYLLSTHIYLEYITGRTDAEPEAPILWSPDAKSWLIGKDPDAGKDWRREEGEDRGWNGWMASWTQQSLTQWV